MSNYFRGYSAWTSILPSYLILFRLQLLCLESCHLYKIDCQKYFLHSAHCLLFRLVLLLFGLYPLALYLIQFPL